MRGIERSVVVIRHRQPTHGKGDELVGNIRAGNGYFAAVGSKFASRYGCQGSDVGGGDFLVIQLESEEDTISLCGSVIALKLDGYRYRRLPDLA